VVDRDKRQCERVTELWNDFENRCTDVVHTIQLADPSAELFSLQPRSTSTKAHCRKWQKIFARSHPSSKRNMKGGMTHSPSQIRKPLPRTVSSPNKCCVCHFPQKVIYTKACAIANVQRGKKTIIAGIFYQVKTHGLLTTVPIPRGLLVWHTSPEKLLRHCFFTLDCACAPAEQRSMAMARSV
jgi:hypothetical protein